MIRFVRLARRCIPLLGVLACCACSGGGSAAPAAGKSAEGAELYASQGCATCHGAEGKGGMLGPSLKGAAANWKRDALVQYLKDPVGYAANDARLKAQAKQFPMAMTKFDMLPKEDLEALADHVLAIRP